MNKTDIYVYPYSLVHLAQYVTIYDVQKGGYRAVNRATIQSVTCEGVTYA